ncbi:MAG: methylenetetrahydrofolate reductase [Sellimonas intestinalis]
MWRAILRRKTSVIEKGGLRSGFSDNPDVFDNHILYNFLYKIREAGITVPVLPGIMPVTNKSQIRRICSLSGTYLPERFKAVVDRFGDNPKAMRQAGVAYATDQVIDLIANGINNIHIYSMNKPEVAKAIMENLSEIVDE